MADTQGFEIVAEVAVPMLQQVMRAAWKSGGDTGGGGVIPEFFDIPPGTTFGPYSIAGGQVQIPQGELDIGMAPGVNGVDLKFGLHFQIEVQNPPVPSLSMLTMTADCHALTPVGVLPGSINVGMRLDTLARANVSATLTSGDPIAANLDTYLAEYLHQLYVNDGTAFPHTVTKTGQTVTYLGFNAYRVDVTVDLYDDAADPAHQILITRTPGKVQISIPIRMRIYNVQKLISLAPTLLQPMATETRMILEADLTQAAGLITVGLSAATVTTGTITPTADQDGANYTANNTTLGGLLDSAVSAQLQTQGQAMAQAMGDQSIQAPTVSQIETAIADALFAQLTAQGPISLWTPDNSSGSPVQVNDVATLALSDALVIAINAGGGANIGAMTNFVPAGRTFAIAVGAAKLLAIIDDAIHRPESEGGFGPSFPPKHFTNVNGHDADLNSLSITLRSGALHMEGDVTVIDAILDSIDVDASFEVDVGLHWEDNADGTQRIVSDPGEPDVDLSLLAWILSFLFGLITFGLIGGIIAIVVLLIVEGIAERIGGALVRDNVTNQVEGIGAWPSELVKIGNVDSHFENPIEISSEGMVMAG
jgi:hypothetical protein